MIEGLLEKIDVVYVWNVIHLTTMFAPKTHEDRRSTSRVPYDSVVGSLIFVMVCTILDLAHIDVDIVN